MAEFIVAIELGSSKITGIAGRKNLDGSISVLAVVKEDSTACIRKGVVYNIDKTMQCLTNIIARLKTTLKSEIAYVYVGVGGQSIRSIRNNIAKDFIDETIITQEMVNELMDTNRNMEYPDQQILDAATQEYKVDQQLQLDPVGIQCRRLEGNFLNIIWRNSYYRNLNKCFEKSGIAIADMYLSPLVLADSVLTEAEKRTGCVLVDLGADTTTVSVYFKNILRHLAVIPLGSNNITKDITSFQMEDKEAERMKLKYASAYTDNADIDATLMLPIDQDRQVENRRFVEMVEGRVEEIIENVWYQVPSEFTDKLLGGIVLTGGGSNMKNIDVAFRKYTHIEKIRIAKFVTTTINSSNSDINAKDGTMNTALALLVKGDMNCAGKEITGDLFAAAEPASATTSSPLHTPDDIKKSRDPNEIAGSGVVLTPTEKEKAEEEARRKRMEREEAERKAAEEEAARLAEEKRKNSTFNKMGRNLKKFFEKMMTEEE
uniref:Cell division protein FtsA n=1 Tax=Prevotella sp. GTC17262 TaxID=3236797 RepID=A0AB33JV27_9BACT